MFHTAVRHTLYGKRHTSRSKPVKSAGNMFEEGSYSEQCFLCDCQITLWRILRHEKRFRDERHKWHSTIHCWTWRMCKFSRHRFYLTLTFGDNADHLHTNRCKLLTFRKTRAPRSIVVQVRVYRTTYHAGTWKLQDAKTKAYLVRFSSAAFWWPGCTWRKCWAECKFLRTYFRQGNKLESVTLSVWHVSCVLSSH